MSNKTIRIFLAIACGVAIGLAIGQKLTTLWQWITPIVSGVVAYLLVDLRGLILAIPQAWEVARDWDWPTKKKREYIRWCVYAWLSISITLGLCLIGLIVLFKHAYLNTEHYFSCMLMAMFPGFLMFLVLLSEEKRNIPSDLPEAERIKRGLREMKRTVRMLFPFVILFYHLPRGVWWLGRYGMPQFFICHLPLAGRFIGRFVWHWFHFVHLDVRLLCLLNTAIFTGIGLLGGGSILAWAVGGGLFGVFDYLIVSVHWLKLTPR